MFGQYSNTFDGRKTKRDMLERLASEGKTIDPKKAVKIENNTLSYTDENGDSYFTGCVEMGVSSFIGNTFIVRSNNGKRVSCGVLKGDMKNAFVLIDPKSDQSLGELGTVVNYTSLKTKSNLLNIEAKFIKPYKSVRVTFDNPKRSFCEKAAPFSVFGDERGNFHGEAIPLGSHVVTAIPYVENNCNGSPGNKLSQKFVVVLEQVRKE